MPFSQIAGQHPASFFRYDPFERLQLLRQMQLGEMSPEELTLMQLLGNRPDARRPQSPAAQPAAIANEPGFFSSIFDFLGAEPAVDAMRNANQSLPRRRTMSLERPR